MKAFLKKRKKLLISLLAAAMVFGIGSTLAYQASGTGAVTNRVSPADVTWGKVSSDPSKSGFYYYCAPLPAGEITPPLMYSVKVGKNLYGGEGQPKTLADFLEQTGFSVTIYQESVLAEPGGLTSLPAIAALFQ